MIAKANSWMAVVMLREAEAERFAKKYREGAIRKDRKSTIRAGSPFWWYVTEAAGSW
ncbi:MAG: hypothetical protein KGQ32_10795 [Xanthomonadaceae bacterium]|nr:hypothetical protein [Xanthomonadaceae bacterium]